jgi:uncharacterized protein YhaN
LAHAQGEGYYSKLAAAEEERALALAAVEREQARAQGTKTLRALAKSKRERMNNNLLTPIETAVQGIFEHVRGGSVSSRLAFEGALHEVRVTVDGCSEANGMRALDTLSLGTQEQAMFALRLAFGELLATRGESPQPQLIVLDDPLVNADPGRQERARELLKRASEKLQILILTARPEDYRAIAVREYDLAALKVL